MLFGSLIMIITFTVLLIRGAVKAFRQKEWLLLTCMLFLLPFLSFMFASVIYGGSPAIDAASNYAGYEPGHYYLVDHGIYTEVSAVVFRRMKTLEIVSLILLVAAVVCSLLHSILKKLRQYSNKTKSRKNHE